MFPSINFQFDYFLIILLFLPFLSLADNSDAFLWEENLHGAKWRVLPLERSVVPKVTVCTQLDAKKALLMGFETAMQHDAIGRKHSDNRLRYNAPALSSKEILAYAKLIKGAELDKSERRKVLRVWRRHMNDGDSVMHWRYRKSVLHWIHLTPCMTKWWIHLKFQFHSQYSRHKYIGEITC